MKKIKIVMSALALTAFLSFGSPVVHAQTTGETTTTTTADDDEDDDGGRWGLLGLLGLAGLLGLKRRDDDHTRSTTTNR